MEDHFFIIVRDDGARFHRHFDSESATTEATRLANENRDRKFFICRAERVAKVKAPEPPIVVEDTNADPIPF